MTADPAGLRAVYESAFRGLLQRARPRKLQLGVDLLLAKVDRRIALGQAAEQACERVYRRCRAQLIRRLTHLRNFGSDDVCSPRPAGRGAARRAEQLRQLLESSIPESPRNADGSDGPADFHCDAGLGGVARWLRAAGYDARFWPGIRDDDLIRLCLNGNSILLTTDRPLMQRAAVRWGVVPAMLVPLGPGKRAQFQVIVEQLQLPRRSARCMRCGGPLESVDKQAVRQQIPPRTYPWCDEYFRCQRCGKLLWRGTHWQKIDSFLNAVGNRDA